MIFSTNLSIWDYKVKNWLITNRYIIISLLVIASFD